MLASVVLLLGVLVRPAQAQQQQSLAVTKTVDELLQTLSARDQAAWAEDTVRLLEAAKSHVLQMIEEAQKNNDIILLNCLSEKLGILKPLAAAAADARDGIGEAVARENSDLVEHNFRKSYISREQGAVYAAEADACIGQVGTSFPGQTRVVPKYSGPGEADSDFGAASGGNTRPPDASPID